MGITLSMMLRIRRALLLVAVVVAALAAFGGTAHALEVGISDSDAATTTEPLWPGLKVNRIRIVVPYDVATTTGTAGIARRQRFERAIANAAAHGVAVEVAFSASRDDVAPGTGAPIAPSATQFGTAFTAFRQHYPQLTVIAPWNEPNNPDASHYPLGSSPQLAADYWLQAASICPGCTIVAGDFAGIANDDAYVDAYQAELGAARPAVWAFHAHSDINQFQVSGPDSARVTRYYLSKLQGAWAGSQIWIDEVGARYRDASGFVWGDASQQQATEFLLGLSLLDPRITAIYYYNFSNQCATAAGCAIQDRGLASPTPFNGESPGYDAADRARAAYGVIASRGPMIRPAEPVPPVVTITQPGQSAALGTRTPTFAGAAAVGGHAQPAVTLQIDPGAGESEGSTPVQTLTTPVSAAGAWSLTTAPLADGTYTAQASQVGNPSSAGFSQDTVFTIDTVRPTATITGGPDARTGARTASWTLNASEPGATFRCAIDGKASVPCTSPLELSKLAVGRHSLGVRAIDPAGNLSLKVAKVRWRVVSLATALAPRAADLGTTFEDGLPLAASCTDACKLTARLYVQASTARSAGIRAKAVSRRDAARPRGKGWVVIAGASAKRKRAGSPVIALKPRASGRPRTLTVALGLTLHPHGGKPLVVRRTVTLIRGGVARTVAAHGLPVTVACASACSERPRLYVTRRLAKAMKAPGRRIAGSRRNGLPRGGYTSLGSAPVRLKHGGARNASLKVPRSVRGRLPRMRSLGVRVVGLARGPGTPARALSWPLRVR